MFNNLRISTEPMATNKLKRPQAGSATELDALLPVIWAHTLNGES